MSASSDSPPGLPIEAALPAIREALAADNRLVLSAPPGAGKTTRVPLDLLDAPWRQGGKILILEPRRLAARMAAARLASTLDDTVGGRVGVATRVERRVSARTEIEVITDGLFVRRLLDDPELAGIAAVLFDEFHERSLSLDLGLALAAETQGALRPDLRLVLMSATLDVARIGKAFGGALVESEGRQYPVETRYLGRTQEPIEDQMARAVRRALRECSGSILCFLPGRKEIERTAERLAGLGPDIILAPLFGAMEAGAQDLAVAPVAPPARKVVLATDIAESALTIEGVGVVIDAGLARLAAGGDGLTNTLVTRRAARANVDQRRGRAGRLGPGVCYRLWDEAETRGLIAEAPAEILSADLSGVLLTLAEWGVRDPQAMFFLDPPSPGRLAAAREELIALGALHADGTLLPKGKAMAALPLPPRLAALIAGTPAGPQRLLAAEVAALLSEAALGGASTDLRARLERFRQDRSPRARALAQQALRWAGSPAGPVAPVASLGSVLAAALPQHLARRRAGDEPRFLLAAGRAGRLPATDSLAGAEWLVVAGLTGAAGEGRITAAAPLTEAEALAAVPPETTEVAEYDRDRALLRARRITRIGAITLRETPLPTPSGPVALAALLAAVRAHGLSLVPAFAGLTVLLARCAAAQSGKARPTLLSEAMLLDQLEAWLAPLLGDPPRLDRPCTEALATAALGLLPWEARQYLDEAAPRQWRTPAGRLLEIDYTAEGGPTIAARVQEFYGCKVHPTVGEARRPLRVSLLSPAQRQIAITLDLPGFWAGAYRDMAKDMRGQYPRHDWPEDPGAAMAHVGKTKARLNREGA